jgi:hypothetical protein
MVAVAVAAVVLIVERASFGFAVKQVTSDNESHFGEAVTVWAITNVVLLGPRLMIGAGVVCDRIRTTRPAEKRSRTNWSDYGTEGRSVSAVGDAHSTKPAAASPRHRYVWDTRR